MRLVDKDGNETDYELIEWGPGGVWGFEELRRDVVQRLPDYEGHDVSMGFDDQPRIAYNDIPLEVVEGFVERGLIAESYRFSVEALDLMRRNPDARLDATAECSFDEEAGWHAVIRGVWLQEKEPTAADLAACQDMSRTFLLPTDGATGSRSLAWLPGSRVVWRAPTPTTGAATHMRIWRGPMSFPSRQWKAWGQAPRNRTIPKAAFLSPAVPWRSSSC